MQVVADNIEEKGVREAQDTTDAYSNYLALAAFRLVSDEKIMKSDLLEVHPTPSVSPMASRNSVHEEI